jgi:hypothetical protein
VDDELGAPEQRLVRHRVHVADDDVRLVASRHERVGPPVHADEDRLEVADVRADDREVAFGLGAARHDEGVSVAEACPKLRHLDAFGEEGRLLAEVAKRVLGECLERFAHATALFVQVAGELVDLALSAGGEAGAVAEEARAANDEWLAFLHRLEEPGARCVDQADPAFDQGQRPRVRVVARQGRRDVDHHAHAALQELLGRDAVEVGMVDDGDVVRTETADEAFRPLVQFRGSVELDEGHLRRTVERNSAPPSIRSSSSRRSEADSRSIWV